jgi:murein DD-endopeptidase MepM/ murein hydrolase activator NlpD
MYMHFPKLAVVDDAAVKQGDVLGFAGAIGRSTGPQLLWRPYVNSTPVNPGRWLTLQTSASDKPPGCRKPKS